MKITVVRPHNVGDVSSLTMRKYAVIGRPIHAFVDVYFKHNASSLLTSKNEYALSFKGRDIDDLSDYVPTSTLGSQWRFETLNDNYQSNNSIVYLLKEDGQVFLCADASVVDYIEFHTLDRGDVVDIKAVDDINETPQILSDPQSITLYPTELVSSGQTNTVLYQLGYLTDTASFHVILHEGTWTKMTFLPKIVSNNTTYPILIGIFNIKGNIPNFGIGFDNLFSIEKYGTVGNLYPPNNTIDNVQWVDVNVDPNSPNYYKISADTYCEFDVVVKNTGNIRKVVPPAIYSFWDIGQFANLNLHTFTMRGHVFRTISQNNGQCGCGQFAGVSIKMPSYNFGCSCDDGLGVEFSNSSNLKELHITTSDAVGVPGESVVFNIGDSTSPNLPATIQYFNTVGTYRHPLYGVSGNLNALSGFSNLIELRISYTSIHGNITYLPSMSNLQKVNLTNCDIEGDIYKFSGCTELKEMIAQLKDITGNLYSLFGLSKLVKIDLSDSQVEGNIADLTYLNLLSIINLNNCDVYGDLSTIPISCIEFNAKGNSTPFTCGTINQRHNRSAQINNTLQYAKPFSIPGLIEIQSCADVENLLSDMSLCQGSITDGVILVRVVDIIKPDILFDSEWNQLNITANSLSNALAAKGFTSVEIKGRGNNKITII